jgi:hypothetical protein
VHSANYFFRSRCGRPCQSIAVEGIAAHAKQAVARAVRYANKFAGESKKQFVYPKTFVVDPQAPHGYRILAGQEGSVVAPHEELIAEAV